MRSVPAVGKEARGLRPGDKLGPYQVLGRVGNGGMASVYVVRRSGFGGLEKLLAMKVIHPHLAEKRGVVQMFLDEIRMSSRIDHPHVVRVIDAGQT